MESGTTIIGLILLFIMVLPFILLSKKKSKGGKHFLSILFDLAKKNNSKISEHELWNNVAVGIDRDTHQLYFIRKTATNNIVYNIDLSEIQKCRLVNSNRKVNYKGGSYNVIDRLELAFTYCDKIKPEIILEFYNSEYDSVALNGELQLASKWLKIINTELAQKTQKKGSPKVNSSSSRNLATSADGKKRFNSPQLTAGI